MNEMDKKELIDKISDEIISKLKNWIKRIPFLLILQKPKMPII